MKSAITSFNNLLILGIISITIGAIIAVSGYYGYNYSFFSSISESATTPLTTSMILPFCLGGMGIFFMGYSGYDKTDFWLTKLMALGAFIVTMCPCKSYYLTSDRIGLFGLDANTSNVIHYVGALVMFLAFIYWVMFQFTKSNVLVKTKEKRIRNSVYLFCSLCSLSGIILIILNSLNLVLLPNAIFWGEELILIPLGIAVIIKSGILLKDK